VASVLFVFVIFSGSIWARRLSIGMLVLTLILGVEPAQRLAHLGWFAL
jgi:hypothetical protein